MRTSSLIAALAAGLSLVAAHPIVERYTVDDYTILNYALTLEFLERKFYMEGLAKFKHEDFVEAGFPDPFYDNLKTIYFDERTHVDFLVDALTPSGYVAKEADYNFGLTDAKSFVGLASVLEGVGVSAYLGAAASIKNPAYLTAAGTILTIEARHSSYIRAVLGEKPFPKPFDTPLDFNQVYSLAAQFITAFDGGYMLPFMAFPKIVVVGKAPLKVGSALTFQNAYSQATGMKGSKITKDTKVYAVFYSGLDKYYVLTELKGNDYTVDKIPSGPKDTLPPTGQVYVVLTTADGTSGNVVSDDNIIAGVGLIEVLP